VKYGRPRTLAGASQGATAGDHRPHLSGIEARLDALNPDEDGYERLAVIYGHPDRSLNDVTR
jgi:hypothetical protein